MANIGTQVIYTTQSQTPTAPFDTANAFMVGLSDWGPSSTYVTIQSLAQAAATVGPRSGTNTTIYDSLDVFFREGGTTAFFARVTGAGASAASLTVNDANGSAALIVSAAYVGNYGNNINVAITNSGSSYTITLTDTYGNSLVTSPVFTTRAAAAAWSQSYVKIAAITNDANALPATLSATSMTGGTDDRTSVTLAQWKSALANLSSSLGPGQVLAPGQSDWGTSALAGITSALGAHALDNNRVAIVDLPDNTTASTLVSDVSTSYNSLSVGPIGFWAGNLSAPGVTPGTTRSIPPSPVIAALCARVDATGNPNLAAAGGNWPLQYCTGPANEVSGTNETYDSTDRSTLNDAGINVFANRFGTYENYGFVSSVLPTLDATFWQFNHLRLRMAIGAEASVIAEGYVFSQLDGAGNDILSFNQQLQTMLSGFLASGALFGTQPGTTNAAFSVDTGPSVNTPQSMQAGNLNANLYVRMSPFAELVTITVSNVSITSQVPTGSTASSTGSSGF